jgi:hypothetical protein
LDVAAAETPAAPAVADANQTEPASIGEMSTVATAAAEPSAENVESPNQHELPEPAVSPEPAAVQQNAEPAAAEQNATPERRGLFDRLLRRGSEA